MSPIARIVLLLNCGMIALLMLADSLPVNAQERVRLGVVGEQTERSKKYDGVEITQVLPNTPAQFGELIAGRHVITHVNGRRVRTNDELRRAVFNAPRYQLSLRLVDLQTGENFERHFGEAAAAPAIGGGRFGPDAPGAAPPGIGNLGPAAPVQPTRPAQWTTRVPIEIPIGTSPTERNFDLNDAGDTRPQLVIDNGGFQGAIVSAVEFSPDGRWLAAGADVVRIWDVASHKLMHTLRGQREFGGAGYCSDLAWSSDGEHLLVAVTGFNGSVRVYSRSSGFAKIEEVLGGHDGHVGKLAFSPDGETLATAGVDNMIHLWDWPTRRKIKSYRVEHPIANLAFPCRDPNVLALASDGNVYYWTSPSDQMADAQHRQKIHQLYRELPVTQNGQANPRAVAISLDPDLSVVGIAERNGITVDYASTVWKPNQKTPAARHEHSHFVTAVALHTKSGLAASADALGSVELWSLENGKTIAKFVPRTRPIYAVQFDSDSQISFGRKRVADNQWDWNSYGSLTHTLDLDHSQLTERSGATPKASTQSHNRKVSVQTGSNLTVENQGRSESTLPMGRSGMWRPMSFAFLSGQPLGFEDAVVVGLNNGIVTAYDPTNLLVKRSFLGHSGPVWGLAQSPNGKLLATGSSDGTIRLWKLDSPKGLGNLGCYADNDLRIYHVIPGTPTAEAGLQIGDRLINFDGQPFGNLIENLAATGQWPFQPGQSVTVAVERDGKPRTFPVRLSDTGDIVEPLLSIYIDDAGSDWIAWTQDGYYDASPNGERLIGWQTNRGRGQVADITAAWQLRRVYYRPDVVRLVLETGSTRQALESLASETNSRPQAVVDIRAEQQRLAVPEVRLDEPRDGLSVTGSSLRLKGRVTATGSLPLTEVRVTVNGRPIPGFDSKNIVLVTTPQPQSNRARELNVEVPLVPGRNVIEVVALTESATSQPVRREVIRQQASEPAARPNLYVVAIGTSKHANPLFDLEYADDDARDLVHSFQAQAGRMYDKVESRLLLDADVTERNLRRELKWLREQVTQHDLAIVFVSGHGVPGKAGQYYYVPHDFDGDPSVTGIPWSQFIEPLSGLPCKVLLCMDTCHAAGVLGPKAGRSKGGPNLERSLDYVLREMTSIEVGMVVMTSSTGKEASLEHSDWGHGAFALALIEGLTGKHIYERAGATPKTRLPADLNGDGVIEIKELDLYVTQRVRELTDGAQHPVTRSGDIPSFPVAAVK